jgi:hypothetical protein
MLNIICSSFGNFYIIFITLSLSDHDEKKKDLSKYSLALYSAQLMAKLKKSQGQNDTISMKEQF